MLCNLYFPQGDEKAKTKLQKSEGTSGAKLRGKMMVRLTVLMIVIKYSRLTRGGKKVSAFVSLAVGTPRHQQQFTRGRRKKSGNISQQLVEKPTSERAWDNESL